jgi:hypothetical protein
MNMKMKTHRDRLLPPSDKPERMSAALRSGMKALEDLDFDERRQILRWLCDVYSISAKRLPLVDD